MKEFITFKTASLAKEKGYNLNEECVIGFSPDGNEIGKGNWDMLCNAPRSVPRPYQFQLQRWLRNVHRINIVIEPVHYCYNISRITQYDKIEDGNNDFDLLGLQFKDFLSFEEALEHALSTALKFIS